jgi:hypothetical protein
MHLKKIAITLAVSAFIIGFSSCKKSTTASSSTTTGTNAQVQADDQTFYTNETNNATDDANAALNNSGGSYNQRPAGVESPAPILWPCDTSSVVVDTTSSPRTITINYSGSDCQTFFNHKRTGSIAITFNPGFKWGTIGSSITIAFNLKVVRTSDSKTILITGTRTITNTTGGLLKNLVALDSVGYSITDNTTVTFDNGSQRSWNTSLHRTYTYSISDGLDITTTGSLSGTNRYGDNFSASIAQPLVVEGCSGLRYTSGQVTYTGGAGGTSTVTFGLGASGDPISGCVTGLLYYKFVWAGPNGGSFSYNGVY